MGLVGKHLGGGLYDLWQVASSSCGGREAQAEYESTSQKLGSLMGRAISPSLEKLDWCIGFMEILAVHVRMFSSSISVEVH
jgi:hypothetical protein